jgi:DNA-binding MarR family transcriptional regulator
MPANKDTIGRYISMLYRSAGSYLSKELSQYKIGSGQFTFLTYLYNHSGVTQEVISSDLYIDKGTTAKAIKKLEELGYVYRIIDESDKRAYKVYITNEALMIKDEIYAILHRWNLIITTNFTEEEKNTAFSLLKRMVENKNNYFSKGENKNG